MSLSEFFASLNQNGQLLAGLGAVFAALFAGIGSAVGVGHAGQFFWWKIQFRQLVCIGIFFMIHN